MTGPDQTRPRPGPAHSCGYWARILQTFLLERESIRDADQLQRAGPQRATSGCTLIGGSGVQVGLRALPEAPVSSGFDILQDANRIERGWQRLAGSSSKACRITSLGSSPGRRSRMPMRRASAVP